MTNRKILGTAARAAADAACVLVAFGLAITAYAGLIRLGVLTPRTLPALGPYARVAFLYASTTLLVFAWSGLYSVRVSVLNLWELRTTAKASLVAAAFFLSLAFMLKLEGFSRIAVMGGLGLSVVLVVVQRRFMAVLLHRRQLRDGVDERTLIIGAGEVGQLVMKKIVGAHLGRSVVGFLDDEVDAGTVITCAVDQASDRVYKCRVLGGVDDLEREVIRRRVGEILIAAHAVPPEALSRVVSLAGRYGIEVGLIPSIFGLRPDQLSLEDLSAIPVLRPLDRQATRSFKFTKRALDLVLGGTLLMLSSPLWAMSAVLVWVETGRPVFFTHERVGLDGRRFRMFKFRTMRKDAPRYSPSPVRDEDPRITRIGKVLRISGIDELPQLINVFRGEMSLVGPRPEMPFIVDSYSEVEKKRLTLKPGITGIWQLSPDRHAQIHENLEYDLYYIHHASPLLDILILIETVLRTIEIVGWKSLQFFRRGNRALRPFGRERRVAGTRADVHALPPDVARHSEGPTQRGDHLLVLLDRRCEAQADTRAEMAVKALEAVSTRWPVKILVNDDTAQDLDRVLPKVLGWAKAHGTRFELISASKPGDLFELIKSAGAVITDVPQWGQWATSLRKAYLPLHEFASSVSGGSPQSFDTIELMDLMELRAPVAPPKGVRP